jgi:RHS repeat-associated protein
VTYTYTNGRLTGIPNFLTSLTYQPSGLPSTIKHANGITDYQRADPNGIPRPAELYALRDNDGFGMWTTGTYAYDGSGNVWKMGAAAFLYDTLSRVNSGTVYPGAYSNGTAHTQTYAYDPYGNLTGLTTNGSLLNTPASTATNRLTSGIYDTAGNLTSWSGNTYDYDAFNQMTRMLSGAEDWRSMYTADDERVWSYRVGGNGSLWTLRDLNGKVLRDYQAHIGWTYYRDYVYRDGSLLTSTASAAAGSGTSHYHLDHLGTPRLITDAVGSTAATFHTYYPYGQEIAGTFTTAYTDTLRFTGHERDLANLAGQADDLDYMHARHESPVTGRFLSADRSSGLALRPQSWNRYAYALGNPVRNVDLDGQVSVDTVLGYMNALVSDFIFGAGRMQSENSDFQTGQRYGDEAAQKAGMGLTAAGITSGGVGLVAELPSAGTSTVLVVAGGGVAVYGLNVTAVATAQQMSAEYTKHGRERRDQGRSGDGDRDVGDPNRTIREGNHYMDSKSGNDIYVRGDRVVVVNQEGKIVSSFTNTKSNTAMRIRTGRWQPVGK